MVIQSNSLPSERFVGCFDILGFSDAVRQKGTAALAQVYTQAIEHTAQTKDLDVQFEVLGQVVGQQRWFENIEHVAIFSDTVMVFTKDLSHNSFHEICQFANTVFKLFLYQHLPLRGAIAHGPVILKPSLGLFLGEGILEAHELEQSLDSLGIVLSSKLPAVEAATTTRLCKVMQKGNPNALSLLVPVTGYGLKSASSENLADKFRELRSEAGQACAPRYQNSEEIVAAMLNVDRNLLI